MAASKHSAPPPTEERVALGLAKQGDVQAFEVLIRLHKDALFSLLLRWLRNRAAAEDTFQETVLAAYAALPSYESREETEHGPTFRAWLFRIAVNKAKDFLRAERRKDVREQQWQELVTSGPNAPEGRLDATAVLERSLGELAPKERILLLLRFVEGLEIREIGTILGASETVVKMRLQRARARFRKAAKAMGGG